MTGVPEAVDPWAWAREAAETSLAPAPTARVTAVVVAHNGERWLPRLLESLAAQTLPPTRVIVVDAGSTDGTAEQVRQAHARGVVAAVVPGRAGASFGASVAAALDGEDEPEWLWLLHDDMVADAEALDRLVTTARETAAAVVGPLLIEPRRRRGRAARVSEAGQTVTEDGVITGVVPEGVLDQGQLVGGPVLGLNAAGLLVRGAVWRELDGFDGALPSTVQGLEFCWRARLHGHEVVSQPRARLAHTEAATRGLREGTDVDPAEERRRWGLTLHEAYRAEPLPATERGRLGGASTRRILGHLAGKNFADARAERRAVRGYRADRASVDRLRAVFTDAVGADAPDVSGLRLSRKAARARSLDATFGRMVDWLAAFGDRGGGLGLDALTGDDFARDDQSRRRLSPTWVAGWVLIVGALVAGRSLFSFDPLGGPQLLPVPASFGGLWEQWTAPVAGAGISAGAPWTGLVWVASLLTLGQPGVLIGLVLLAAVPGTFLVARRLLGRLVDDPAVALVGAVLYALWPVASGAVGSGRLGAVVAGLTLPVLAHQLLLWWDERAPSWPLAGAVALTTTVLTAVEPTAWLGVAAAVGALMVRERSGWVRGLVAVLAPAALLAASPFTVEVVRFPGRLLTGIEPVLAPLEAPGVFDVLLVRTAPAAPDWWVSAVVFGGLWLLGLAGAFLKPGSAPWALAVALAGATVAVLLTRLVVAVPPAGASARPEASAWSALLVGALLWSAAVGLDGLRAEIASRGFGRRHAAVYATAVVAVLSIAVGAGWWLVAGAGGLERRSEAAVPAFIRKDAAAGASRILALAFEGDRVGWGLLEDDLPRLGDGERGLAFGGSPEAAALAGSVAHRLAIGSGDERIVPDLHRLGVGHLWVTGASSEQRAAISNAPGLGVGSADEQGANWVVPGSGRLVLLTDGQRTKLDPAAPIPPGPAGRVLVVAEPGAWASVAGSALERVADVDGSPAFAVPAEGGPLATVPGRGFPAWVLLQGLGLLALLALAAPASGTAADAHARAPRRARRGRS
nr:glycosyltransferase family 2 protein [Propionibacterium sp.]